MSTKLRILLRLDGSYFRGRDAMHLLTGYATPIKGEKFADKVKRAWGLIPYKRKKLWVYQEMRRAKKSKYVQVCIQQGLGRKIKKAKNPWMTAQAQPGINWAQIAENALIKRRAQDAARRQAMINDLNTPPAEPEAIARIFGVARPE